MRFGLLSVGPYVELTVAGEVAITTMTGVPGAGRWGIWVQDGSVIASDVRWAPMRRPSASSDSGKRDTEEAKTVG